ncbi:MAG: hypothetical protein H6998_19110 [Hahellaceae bacterium]|nr:hypothetical protein [Hahellaceae bacterium]
MKTKIVVLGDNELGFTIPQDLLESGRFLPGDSISYRVKTHGCEIINLSCPVLPVARFRRNLNGILRNMNNPRHPLRRVFVARKKNSYWVVPHEISLQPDFLKQADIISDQNNNDRNNSE